MKNFPNLYAATGLILFILVFYLFLPILDSFIYGVFIYYISRPLAAKINSIVIRKDVSSMLTLLFFVIPITTIFLYVLIVSSFEVSKIISDFSLDLRIFDEQSLFYILTKKDDLAFRALYPSFLVSIQNFLEWGIFIVTSLISIFLKIFISFLIAFYLLTYGEDIRKFVTKNVKVREVLSFLEFVDSSLYEIYFGSLLTIIATIIIAFLFLLIWNSICPQTLKIAHIEIISILLGFSTLIPGIGIKAVWIPLFLYLILISYLNHLIISNCFYLLLFLVGINVFVDFTPDLLIRPFVSGRNIPKGVLILTYMMASIVFGFLGLFLGPMILVSVMGFMREILPRLSKS